MDRLVQMISDADIYWGGNYDMDKQYFEPTILNNVSFEMASMQKEIFGPILPVISYNNI